MAAHKKLNSAFFKEWTPEMAYVLGFFAADGNMVRSKSGGHFIGFYSTDRALLRGIRRAMGSGHAVADRVGKPGWKANFRMQIGSRTMFEDLVALGMTPAKSKTLRLPAGMPARSHPDFVRGYFDGDGCVYFKKLKYADRKRPRWVLMTVFTSGSRAFLEEFWALLKLHGIRGGCIRTKKRGFDLSLSFKDSVALYELMYHNAPDTKLLLPRKYKLFRRAIQTLYPDAAVAQLVSSTRL